MHLLLHLHSYSLSQWCAMGELPVWGDILMSSVTLYQISACRLWGSWMPPQFPGPHQKPILGWGHGACNNSGSTWTSLYPTAAELVQASPPEEACPLLWGTKSCQGQSAPPQLHSQPTCLAYLKSGLPSAFITHHVLLHLRSGPQFWTMSCGALACWGPSLCCCHMGFLRSQGQVHCHGQHWHCPQDRVILTLETFPQPLKC